MSARRARQIGGYTVFALIVLGWAVFLRPQWLGGSSAFITVRGDSMLPTYQNGDFLIAVSQPIYSPTDIVAYRVSADEVGAGHIVVHRIKSEEAGQFVIQGDNNPEPDPWEVSPSDVVGRVVVRLPGFGTALAALLSPTIAGSVAAALTVMVLVARATKSAPGVRESRPPFGRRARAAGSDS